ncbi:MAG TPA: periplasmic heavy metal sensor [Casimicrobiaceae bacterium]
MKRILLAALLAGTLGAVALSLPAQPLHGGSLLERLQTVKAQLNLNTSQQQQWDNAVAQSTAARAAARSNFAQVKAALQAELAKSEPDFAAVAAVGDSVSQQNMALRAQARDAWLALYATFSPEQKAVARDAIKAGIARMEARRRAHGRAAPAN